MAIALALMMGICIGISVLLAQLYGQGDPIRLRHYASTALIAGTVFTTLLSIVCFFITKPILVLWGVPSAVIPDANRYLQIILAGLVFSYLYNFLFSALRAVGNSKAPFLFLIVASVLHIFLDLYFVWNLKAGVAGVAVSTVLSQAIAAWLCGIYIYKNVPLLALKRQEFVFFRPALAPIFRYSWAAAMQQTFVYLGRFLTQGFMNPFGAEAIAGYNAATRIEGFVLTPCEGIGVSASTYVAQNMGARQPDRVKNGFKISIGINIAYALAAGCALLFFAPALVRVFSTCQTKEKRP